MILPILRSQLYFNMFLLIFSFQELIADNIVKPKFNGKRNADTFDMCSDHVDSAAQAPSTQKHKLKSIKKEPTK